MIPVENLKRWQGWKVRIENKMGPDHPDTLTARHNIAEWSGESGNVREACGCPASCCRTGSVFWGLTTPTL